MKIINQGVLILGLSFGLMLSAIASDNPKADDGASQYFLGKDYYLGKGVPQSYTKAFDWLQKAANNTSMSVKLFYPTPDRQDVLAQSILGMMYYKGEGVRQDKAQSKEWFGKACDNGKQSACDNYRILNEQGY